MSTRSHKIAKVKGSSVHQVEHISLNFDRALLITLNNKTSLEYLPEPRILGQKLGYPSKVASSMAASGSRAHLSLVHFAGGFVAQF